FQLSSTAETLAGLTYMADLVIEFSPPHQSNEKLFRMVKACLEATATAPSDLHTILRYFEVWLLKLEGFLPDIRQCAECRGQFNESKAAYVGSDLMFRCVACSRGIGTALSQRLYGQLRATQNRGPYVFAEESRQVPAKTLREMAQLTQQLISRALERQPRVRPTFLTSL
ncbi:MAG: DNA repair protein RecO, partial [Pyrinomonadaceae bacterium]